MKSKITTFFLALSTALLFSCQTSDQDRFQRITAQEAGYSASSLHKLTQYLEQSGSSSLLLVHDGKIFFEWGDIYKKHSIHSIRKALLNSLIGISLKDGKLDLSANLKQLNIQDAPSSLTEEELSTTLDMILKSRSGIYHDATAESEWMKSLKPARGEHKPDAHYYYNNWDFNVAGFIFEKESDLNIFDAFNTFIAEPLGMLHYKGQYATINHPEDTSIPQTDGFYQYEKSKSLYPAYHFRMSAHDLALYGQLYLQKGKWDGEQLIPADWISQSTSVYSVTNAKYNLGYGMLWSVIIPENDKSTPSFYHSGAGVHMLGVYPEQKLVMVHRVDTEKPTKFTAQDLYPIIGMIHGARIKSEQNNTN